MSEARAQAVKRDARILLLRRIAAGSAAALLITAITLTVIYRERLAANGLRGLFGGAAAALSADAFTYEPGGEQVFAAAGNGLAMASTSAIALFDETGTAVFRRTVSFSAPAVFASAGGALFCDVGGTGCFAVDRRGNSIPLEPEGVIQSASRNDSGWVALVTDARGYKGLVSVWDPDGRPQYRWWSGADYVLRACVSPDGKTMAALCAGEGGGTLRLFRLDSEEENAEVDFSGALPFDLCWAGDGSLCAVGTAAMWFFSETGAETGRYDYEGVLLDYETGGADFAAVLTAPVRGASGGTLYSVDRGGRVLGSAELERGADSLSARSKRLLAKSGNALLLFDRGLEPQWTGEAPAGTARALLRARGDALLPGPYGAQLREID